MRDMSSWHHYCKSLQRIAIKLAFYVIMLENIVLLIVTKLWEIWAVLNCGGGEGGGGNGISYVLRKTFGFASMLLRPISNTRVVGRTVLLQRNLMWRVSRKLCTPDWSIWQEFIKAYTHRGAYNSVAPTRKETSYSDRRFWCSYILFVTIIGGILVLFMYITRPASNEIFSPSNKIHREVGRAKDLSAPWYIKTPCCMS